MPATVKTGYVETGVKHAAGCLYGTSALSGAAGVTREAAGTMAGTSALDGATDQQVTWLDLMPQADSRIIFVSESEGNDGTAIGTRTYADYQNGTGGAPNFGTNWNPTNPPSLDPADLMPFQTVGAGLGAARYGENDWVCFKRGDTWILSTAPTAGGNVGLFNAGKFCGRSATEPQVINAYGTPTDPRPVVDCGLKGAIYIEFGTWSHMRFCSVHFTNQNLHDPLSPNFIGSASFENSQNGLYFLTLNAGAAKNVQDWYFEDCVWSYFKSGIALDCRNQLLTTTDPRCGFLRFFRCLIFYNYAHADKPTDPSSQAEGSGAFIAGINYTEPYRGYAKVGVWFEECVFWHNGWHHLHTQSERDVRKHNIYWQKAGGSKTPPTNANIWRNLGPFILNCLNFEPSCVGCQLRNGGHMSGCLYCGTTAGWFIADNWRPDDMLILGALSGQTYPPYLNLAEAIDNVLTEGEDRNNDAYGTDVGGGDGMVINRNRNGVYRGNLNVHLTSAKGASRPGMKTNSPFNPNNLPVPDPGTDALVEDNVVYAYPVAMQTGDNHAYITWQGNAWNGQKWATGNVNDDPGQGTPVTYADPTRTMTKYWQTVLSDLSGGVGTWRDFIAHVCANQRKHNWDPRLGAQQIVAWFKAGYTEV